MASHRDAAFQAFLDNLEQQDGYVSRALLRLAWEAGRRYEAERVEAIVRPEVERYVKHDGIDG